MRRILVVDDEKMVRWALREAAEQAGYSADEAADASEALKAVARETPDVVLLDYQLPDRNGIEVLRDLRKIAPRVPVVMITAHASVGGAVEAMREGAYDYLTKPFEVDEVIQTVARALEAGRLRDEVAHQRERAVAEVSGHSIVAGSPAMQEVLRLVDRISNSGASTLLLLGESGVGKGLVARALHSGRGAGDKPFMNIMCTALPAALLESELFGHEKGAFTDAGRQKKGLFELADGGTVFLDEIGDLSPELQGKLLRFLEEKSFRRVGGTRDIDVSVRIIAATNKDLKKEVDEGRFRQDLFYRLSVIPIHIPALRERAEDVLPLARIFLQQFNQEFGKAVGSIEPAAEELLSSYPWPGNVRELRNAIERAVLLSDHLTLVAGDLPTELRGSALSGDEADGAGAGAGDASFKLPAQGLVLETVEKELVRQALERTHGNRSHAARLLGLNRDQIRYRVEKFHLDPVQEEKRE